MKISITQEIAESFINGNISWCRAQLAHNRRLTANVANWIREYAPNKLESFFRLMSK